jgi:hypothetical protein
MIPESGNRFSGKIMLHPEAGNEVQEAYGF